MLENTLTVGRISEGFVLDHIEAGKSMEIYKYLHLDKLDCCVAIIKNAKSNKMVKGVMIESYIEEGNQKICDHMTYGKSITDPCLGWEDTEKLIYKIAEEC